MRIITDKIPYPKKGFFNFNSLETQVYKAYYLLLTIISLKIAEIHKKFTCFFLQNPIKI